jgi:hypothetical protein
MISAYSVFTHIEAMETTWLMELRRVLRKGGIAWITVHTEGTLADMTPDWPLLRRSFPSPFTSFQREASVCRGSYQKNGRATRHGLNRWTGSGFSRPQIIRPT